MKRIIISMLLLTILCTTILCGCTEDKEVATKDEAAVTTTSTSVVTETTSETVLSTSAKETTVPATVATTVASVATEAAVDEQEKTNDNDYVNESNNSGSNNQNNNQSNNTSDSNDNSVSNSSSGYATKITLDTYSLTLEVNETKELSFTVDGKVSSLNVTPGHFNLLTFDWVDTRTVAVTAHRAGETSLTISTGDGVTATCNVTINYPSVDNITYDTILSYDQINTEKVSKMITDACNEYFATLGMTYDETLDKNVNGWFIGYHNSAYGEYDKSVNDMILDTNDFIMSQVDTILVDYHGCEYTDMRYKTIYYLDGDSYVIIFIYG